MAKRVPFDDPIQRAYRACLLQRLPPASDSNDGQLHEYDEPDDGASAAAEGMLPKLHLPRGRPRKLTDSEESSLMEWFIANYRFGVRRSELLDHAVQQYGVALSAGWWRGFSERMELKCGHLPTQALTKAPQQDAANILATWRAIHTLRIQHPNILLLNVDEGSCGYEARDCKYVHFKTRSGAERWLNEGQQQQQTAPRRLTTSRVRDCVTVVHTIAVQLIDGKVTESFNLPPTILFAGKRQKAVPIDDPLRAPARVYFHGKGWMDDVSVKWFLSTVIAPFLRAHDGPALLLWDQATAHHSGSTSAFLSAQFPQLHVVDIPANATKYIQPVDSVFGRDFNCTMRVLLRQLPVSTKILFTETQWRAYITNNIARASAQVPLTFVARSFERCGISTALNGSDNHNINRITITPTDPPLLPQPLNDHMPPCGLCAHQPQPQQAPPVPQPQPQQAPPAPQQPQQAPPVPQPQPQQAPPAPQPQPQQAPPAPQQPQQAQPAPQPQPQQAPQPANQTPHRRQRPQQQPYTPPPKPPKKSKRPKKSGKVPVDAHTATPSPTASKAAPSPTHESEQQVMLDEAIARAIAGSDLESSESDSASPPTNPRNRSRRKHNAKR